MVGNINLHFISTASVLFSFLKLLSLAFPPPTLPLPPQFLKQSLLKGEVIWVIQPPQAALS